MAKDPGCGGWILGLIVAAVAAALIFRGIDKSSDDSIVTCSADWLLPSDWSEVGLVMVATDGGLSGLTGDLKKEVEGNISSASKLVTARIKKTNDGVVIRNTGPKTIGLTYVETDSADVCHHELSSSSGSVRFTPGKHKVTLYVLK